MVHIQVLTRLFQKRCIVFTQFGKIKGGVRVTAIPCEEIFRLQHGRSFLQKTIVIVACHANINVVVPRDYPLMEMHTNASAAYRKILYVKFVAYAYNFSQYFVQYTV